MDTVGSTSATLIAHCGARKISRNELREIPVPAGTRTHQPLSHFEVVESLIESLSYRFLEVVRDEYAVSPDGMKMFGVMDLNSEFDGCRFSLGLRNSNDKSMRLALTAGLRVMICDNMAFSGDFNPLFHKHTRNLALYDAIALAVDRIHRNFLPLQARVAKMKSMCLPDEAARLVIYEAFVDRKVRGLPRHLLPVVHQHYFSPKYEDFEPRTLWSLSNAFTSAFKELGPLKHFELTARLGEFLNIFERQEKAISLQPQAVVGGENKPLPPPAVSESGETFKFHGDAEYTPDEDFEEDPEAEVEDSLREEIDYEEESIDDFNGGDAGDEQFKEFRDKAA